MRFLWLPLIAVMGCGGACADPFESDDTGGSAASNTGGAVSTGGSATGGAPTTRSSGGVVSATGGLSSTGGASSTGGSASGGAVSASTGGVAASTGGLPATTGGSPASTGGASASTGGVAASTGGVQATGGAADPLAPYPAPDCPGFMALRSGGLGTCIGLKGRFYASGPAAKYCNVVNPIIETCGSTDAIGDSPDAPVIYVKEVENLKILRGKLDSAGKCPYACEAP